MTDETRKGSYFVIKETSTARDVGACRVYFVEVWLLDLEIVEESTVMNLEEICDCL
jgi:hypothetical protein